jgi:hypothetical protein
VFRAAVFIFVTYCCRALYRFISLIILSLAFRGFVLSGFETSQGLPKNKIRHSDSSVDRTIEIVQQQEQVFESYPVVVKEMKKKINHSDDNVSAK